MADTIIAGPKWIPAFLDMLAEGQSVSGSARAAGIAPGTAYARRRTNARFAGEWEKAFRKGGRQARTAGFTRTIQWKKPFLEALAESSNVSASAASVNIPVANVYRIRREDPQFAAKWSAALLEGYEHLEMELLGYLRDPAPDRKMDVASGLRLLAAHRETVARERAFREDEDEQAVLDSIDAFIDEMRQRRAANTAILLAPEEDPDRDDGAL